ncbi:MAG: carboxypeptidase-like regulatory domain-containing protein [Bacteroidota bacterium]
MFNCLAKTCPQLQPQNMYKRLLFFFILSSTAFAAYAQRPLTDSRISSYYTYIYKLDASDISQFYNHRNKEPGDKLLHNLVDSIKTDKVWENNLPAGNYLKVYALQNNLQYTLIENHSAFLKLMHNNNDLRFILLDKKGTPITNASVYVNNHPVAYDEKTALYHKSVSKKDSLIRVDYEGVINYFPIKQSRYYNSRRHWLKRTWYSITRMFSKPNYNSYRYRQNRKYTGFMVFNKPLYKPNDTVKFKAFILNSASRKPISVPQLLVRLCKRSDEDGKIIGRVNSYRNGGYEYSFVLSDSLKIDLDEEYAINLEDLSAAKYDLDKYDGDKSESEILAQRKVYFTGSFKYEEYELKTIHFSMRTDKKEHGPGVPLSVYFKATDENDLPVPDGRIRLTLTTVGALPYNSRHVFVPDTLWEHKMPLDPIGETKIILPDSIFPKANISYHLDADFLNSDNELQSAGSDASYSYDKYRVNISLSADTLLATVNIYGKPAKMPAIISAINEHRDTISKTRVILPYKLLFNPNATTYNIETDSTDNDFDLKDSTSNVSLTGYRTADSVFVKINNERKLELWYSVFSGDKLMDAGKTSGPSYRHAYKGTKNVTFVANFIWGGEPKSEKVEVPLSENVLTINVKQPVTVNPGQRAQTDIVVTDNNGKPVPNTDLTAWSLTRKFNYTPPYVPYLDKVRKGKTSKAPYDIIKLSERGLISLNWQRWGREIGLDSIVYYQFTHPSTVFRIEEPATDSITQIAPFVVRDGSILPVHIVYIDDRPVYFSQAQQMQRYSFRVTPGKHTIRFRTVNQSIKIDSVNVERSKKLILSINADTLINHKASFKKVSDTLTDYEAGLVNNYMVTIVNNFDQKMATLTQGDNVILLNPNVYAAGHILAGPVADTYSLFKLKGESPRFFMAEPGYSYLFEPGLLKQKSIPTLYPFRKDIALINGTDNYSQYALTEHETDTLWQQFLDLRSNIQSLFQNKPVTGTSTGRLNISLQRKAPFVKSVIIYRYDDPDYIRVYPGMTTDFGQLGSGKYRLFFLLRGDGYDIADSIVVKPHGNNFYDINLKQSHPKDSVSIKINSTISSRTGGFNANDADIKNDALKLKEAFNDKYFDDSQFGTMMAGRVIGSDDRQPIVGCSISIRGLHKGVVTDVNGVFRLRVPVSGKLIVSYIGYQTRQVDITPGVSSVIVLTPSHNSLQEVVVVGYSSVKKRDLTGAVQTIDAQNTENYLMPGADTLIRIRGMSTFKAGKPLIIVDGVVVEDMGSINKNDIADINLLKDAAATALYGARAANGVIIINTKRKSAEMQGKTDTTRQSNEQSIRKNFSDYAYWQPKLSTDENGKASFTTVFPDDITNWRTFIIGVTDRQQSGCAEKQIKAFKPLSAAFLAPQFAVEGDELSTIGKATNYNAGAAKLTRTFTYNGKQVKQDVFDVTNSKIDTLPITATNTDSLTFEYSIKRDNGYFDGERRKIPVIKQGVKETTGIFKALNGDTTVNLKFDAAKGPVTFRAEASVVPVLLSETEKLRNYKYLCNEQLASKLKGLLMEKHIKKFLGEDFKYEKNINQVIKMLQDNRKTQGTWGWWKDSDEELWISLHVVEALIDAQKDGYQTQLNKQKLTDYLVYQMESYKGEDKLTCLEMLYKLEVKIDYARYFGVIAAENAALKKKQAVSPSASNKLKLMLLKQQKSLAINLDSLLAGQHHTLFGNIYWGDENYNFFDNSIQLTALAYKIIKNDGKHSNLLPLIRGYFLEQRNTGDWRNTYESSLILETILPDVLIADKQVKPASLTLKGSTTETVSKFPYTATLTDNQVSVIKTGTLPVYITGYQQSWNAKPEKVSKDFTVDTWFEKKDERITKLKGGETAQLKAEVTAKGDADFVMIEIPIPAGCSYESKNQSWQNNEVHREYFKEKVSIFCRKLKQGKYEFTVNLTPRYSGKYTLNPAKAELMYFPVFYGREGMKKVGIGE